MTDAPRAPIIPAFEVDQSRTADRAADAFNKMKRMFSDRKYADQPKNLKVSWIPSDKFVALAGPSTDGTTDVIAVSYAAAQRLNEDAVGFCRVCHDHFCDSFYEEIFMLLDYGDGRVTLPVGLGLEDATDQMFRLAMSWLYLHEQAHLFQNHADLIGSSKTVRLATGVHDLTIIDELASHSSSLQLRGPAAATSHVIELSADAEATNRAFELILALDEGSLSKSKLWILICSLSCVFQRFYGERSPVIEDEPIGSHPNPAFRMRMAIRHLKSIILHDKVKSHVPWLSAPKDFDRLVEHATTTASMFWTIWTGDHGRMAVPSFYDGLFTPELTPVPYREALFQAWSEVRTPIERDYRGWGTELAFDPLSPDTFK